MSSRDFTKTLGFISLDDCKIVKKYAKLKHSKTSNFGFSPHMSMGVHCAVCSLSNTVRDEGHHPDRSGYY